MKRFFLYSTLAVIILLLLSPLSAINAQKVIPGRGPEDDTIQVAIRHGIGGEFDLAKASMDNLLKVNKWNERAKVLLRLTTEALLGTLNADAAKYIFLAYSRRNAGELEEALTDINLAIKKMPQHELPYLSRGNIYFAMGQIDASIIDFGHAIELQPTDAVAFYNRGVAYKPGKLFKSTIGLL